MAWRLILRDQHVTWDVLYDVPRSHKLAGRTPLAAGPEQDLAMREHESEQDCPDVVPYICPVEIQEVAEALNES